MFRLLAVCALVATMSSCQLIKFGLTGETPSFGDAPQLRKELSVEFEHIGEQKIYQEALNASDKRVGRDALIRHYVVRIQNYHEVMNNDIFTNSAVTGSMLDVVVVAAAAIATAVTPLSTKTWWAAVATIAGGARLALSKNILQEKSANAILYTMIEEREARLMDIKTGMDKPIDQYTLDRAIIDLSDYFNTGSLDKSSAQAEAKSLGNSK